MLQIRDLKKIYKDNRGSTRVFDDLNLRVDKGEFVAIFGPNGCGKSTLLNIISGITTKDGGTISFDTKSVDSLKIGFVFQDYRNSLFPWMKVKENITFPLKLRGFSERQIDSKIAKLKSQFNFNLNLDSYPYELSGGQQQFIALLRSLVFKPDLFLLDEPFSSLDYQTTLLMLEKLTQIWGKMRTTTILVSHEIDDAIFLAQKIVVLSRRPARVLKVFSIPFLYPRKISIIGSKQFTKIKNDILKLYTKEIKGGSIYEN